MAEFTVKTAEQVRNDILRTYRAGLMSIGVANPNVGPGSDVYVLAQAVGNQLEVSHANAQILAEGLLPDTATGDQLERWRNIYGLSKRTAAGATGAVVFETSAPTYVAIGSSLIDDLGQRFEVTVGGSYADGDTIPVEAIDTGADTNHEAGDVLRWVTPPPFAAQTVTVAAADLTGGVDEETDDVGVQRLLERIQNPPLSGNPSHVASWAEESSTLVQKAFVYPAVNGPGNYAVTVTGYATDVSKARSVSAIEVANAVAPYVAGKSVAPIDIIVTSAENVAFDLALFLSLPSSPKASPPGPGGGWTDGATWPRNANLGSTFRCLVTSVTSSTAFTVDAPSSPTAGVTQICFLSPVDWNTYTATVVAVSGSAGAYAITLDKPFPGIAVGNCISPNATNAEIYFDAILAQFAAMGPGEVLDSSSPMIGRGFRHPPPAQAWPYKVDATMLRAVVNASDEVLDADFAYRTSSAAPAVPSSVLGAPKIYVPQNIAFYERLT